MTIPLIDFAPFLEGEVPPDYWFVEFEDLYMRLTDYGLTHEEMHLDIFGMAAVAIWIGEVSNGGTAQYYTNKIVGELANQQYLRNLVSTTLWYIDRIGFAPYSHLYRQSMLLFARDADAIVKFGIQFYSHQTDETNALDHKIYSMSQEFENAFVQFALQLGSVRRMQLKEYDELMNDLKTKVALRRDPTKRSRHWLKTYFSEGKLNVTALIRDRRLETSAKSVKSFVTFLNANFQGDVLH